MTILDEKQDKINGKPNFCIGSGIRNETGEEIISCSGYGDFNDDLGSKPMMYSILYYGTTVEMVKLAKMMMTRMKVRENMKESLPD